MTDRSPKDEPSLTRSPASPPRSVKSPTPSLVGMFKAFFSSSRKTSATASYKWETRLAECGLPGDVQHLIRKVVSGSRLSRFEKSQVADELIAHFEDGHRSGKKFEQLAVDFGDPETAATLIRQGKLRSRSMTEKMIRLSVWPAGFSLAGLVWLWIWFYSGKPNPSTDYMLQINRGISSIPPDERAWEIYREPWTTHEFSEGPKGHFEEIFYRNEGADDDYRFVRPEDGEQWERAIAKLEQSQDLLEALRVGGTKPALGLELQIDPKAYSREDRAALFPGLEEDGAWSGTDGMSDEAREILDRSVFGVLLPHVQSFRKAARILHVDTRWAMEQGDTERAIRNLEAVFGLARQASEPSILVCALVGMAINQMGCDQIDELIAAHGDELTFSQLSRLQQAVSKNSIRDFVRLEGESAMFMDLVQRIYTDDGAGDGRITAAGMEVLQVMTALIGSLGSESSESGIVEQGFKGFRRIATPIAASWMPGRKELTEKFNKLLDSVESRMYQPLYVDDLSEINKEINGLENKYEFIKELFPGCDQIKNAMYRTIGDQSGTVIAIAVLRYQKKYGKLPENASQLVPDFLDEIPDDPANGKPLNYIIDDDGFRIYSVGVDGDDDRGRAVLITKDGSYPAPGHIFKPGDGHELRPQRASEFSFARGKYLDGDWVIWPRLSDQ